MLILAPLRWMRKLAPKCIAIAMVGLLAAVAWNFSRYIRLGDLVLNVELSCGAVEPRATTGAALLDVKDEQKGKFSIGGNVYLPKERMEQIRAQYSEVWLHIEYLDTNTNFIGGNSLFDVELDLSKSTPYWGTQEVMVEIPRKSPRFSGDYDWYPFDEYRVGVKAVSLSVSNRGQSSWKKIPLEFNFGSNLSSGFEANRPRSMRDFVRKTESSGEGVEDKEYAQDECPLVISRTPWFRMMAVLLALLLLTPAIYLLYRRDVGASLELAGAIIAVATIRVFFLGMPSNWDFLPVDLVLAGIVVLTAVIPLWHLGDEETPKKQRKHDGV